MFDQKIIIFFSAVNQLLVIKILDPDWCRIRIGIQYSALNAGSGSETLLTGHLFPANGSGDIAEHHV
jgi:hypothetical protein